MPSIHRTGESSATQASLRKPPWRSEGGANDSRPPLCSQPIQMRLTRMRWGVASPSQQQTYVGIDRRHPRPGAPTAAASLAPPSPGCERTHYQHPREASGRHISRQCAVTVALGKVQTLYPSAINLIPVLLLGRPTESIRCPCSSSVSGSWTGGIPTTG
jgi:hypothetical protein